MSDCNYTSVIYEQECIGDSLVKINNNFVNLDNATCDLHTIVSTLSTTLNEGDSDVNTVVYNNSATWINTSIIVDDYFSLWLGQYDISSVNLSSVTLTLNEQSKFLTINTTVSSTVIIPTDSVQDFPVGSQITISRIGDGTVSLSASSGVGLRSAEDKKRLRVRNSTATVVKLSANEWLLFGDIV